VTMKESSVTRGAAPPAESKLAPKWSPRGLVQRWRKTMRTPGDFQLALRIGRFIWRVPTEFDPIALPDLLAKLRAAPRPVARDLVADIERIKRLQNAWLRLPFFRSRDNCYLRTFTFYRFLDPGGRDMRVHFVVEPAEREGERLKGHAWVTVDGKVVGGLPPGLGARAQQIYSFPPVGGKSRR
jgi:hypothetical protein